MKSVIFDYFNFDYFPEPDGLLGQAEFWFNIFPADMYIICNGYHNIYANFRNYLKVNNIPFLLTEYSSINDCFYFDTGLHAEASIPVLTNNKVNIDFLSEYIKPRYSNDTNIILLNKLQTIQKKKILFVGMWDEAAGFNKQNNEESKMLLSPFFNSSFDAAIEIINTDLHDCIFILKSHPYDNHKEDLKNLSNDKNVFYIDKEIGIDELIQLSDVVITIASTVSILTVYYEKPIIMLGNTYVSNFNYSLKLTKENNIQELIKEALVLDNVLLKERKEEFFYHYIFDYEIYTHNKRLISQGVKSFEKLALKCKIMLEFGIKKEGGFFERIEVVKKN